MMTNAMTPAQYFGLDTKSRYRDLFNEIYKLTQVSRVEAEIEDGEIEAEEEELNWFWERVQPFLVSS